MDKYKLLKDYPPYKVGDIVSSNGNNGYINLEFKEESKIRVIIPEQVVENETNWFEIIEEMPKWAICIKESNYDYAGELYYIYEILKVREDSYSIKYDGIVTNVSKSRFNIASKEEITAHKLGFHISDKVWHRNTNTSSEIVQDFIRDHTSNLLALTDKSPNGVQLNYLTTKKPTPKIVTEEGTELYRNDKCWFVTTNRSEWAASMHRNFVGDSTDLRCKYFSSESNAKQYFIELQAKKREIEIGTDVFCANTKTYFGKVKYILFINNSVQLNTWKKGYVHITSLLTLKELAKEEGLEIGMTLNKYLTLKWLHTYNEYYNTAYKKIKNFTIIANEPYFILENDAPLKITGFKKFKDQWEIKQKDSDLDIDNTCTTCKFNIHDDPQTCEPCSYLDNRFRESNYK